MVVFLTVIIIISKMGSGKKTTKKKTDKIKKENKKTKIAENKSKK